VGFFLIGTCLFTRVNKTKSYKNGLLVPASDPTQGSHAVDTMPLNRADRAGRGQIKKYTPPVPPKTRRKKTSRRAPAPEHRMDWRLNRVLALRVQPQTPDGPGLAERMKLTVSTSYKHVNAASFGTNALHETEHISMHEALQNDDASDLFLAGLWDFCRELYLAAPSQAGLSARLGDHHPETLPPLTAAQRAVMNAAFQRS